MTDATGQREVAIATRTLALLHQQADEARAELLALREDLARVRQEAASQPSAQLLEANEQLVLAAMRAEVLADTTRRRLGEMTSFRPSPVASSGSPSGDLGRAEYQMRIQELRVANEQLVMAAISSQELEADAEQSHSRQITFLAMAAHELRNPLLPLRLAARMLTHSRTDEQLVQLQETINSQVGHMARLIGDLLDGSRVSTGKFRLQRTATRMTVVLDQAIETCQPALDARRHTFKRLVPAELPTLNCDSVRLVQVFSNLLENAAKYTPEGGEIVLEAVVLGDVLTVTVSDNGIGITEQALPHVFELFVQDDHATVHNQGGLGIGLAVVGELVAAHGGSVVAKSAGVNLGSQFIVTLPLLAPAPSGTAA